METVGEIGKILEWLKHREDFDSSIVSKILEFYEDHNRLTPNQINAIDNIYERWKIQKWFEQKDKK